MKDIHDLQDNVINEINSNLYKQLDDIIIEGLKRKGFEFNNHHDLVIFVKEHCRCDDYTPIQEKIYLVNDVPFLSHKYKTEIDYTKLGEYKISASLGSYRYL